MGRRGPPPKPTRLAELQGNPGKRPLNKREPRPTPGAPGMPDWLSREAKAEWRRLVPQLERLGLLTKVDRAGLAAYCQAHAELADATKLLEAEGRVLEEPVTARQREDGVEVVKLVGYRKKLHPAVRLQRDAFARVKQFLGEFGLTPATRARLVAPGEQGEGNGDDPDLRLFGGSAL
jgi:P27 family predicted phage terminase small subunit